jgi:hypothetical protein
VSGSGCFREDDATDTDFEDDATGEEVREGRTEEISGSSKISAAAGGNSTVTIS